MDQSAVCVLLLVVACTLVTSAPTRCCMNRQYRAYITDPRSFNRHNYETSQMFFDFDAKMTAIQNYQIQPSGSKTSTDRIVQDYNQKKWFTIQPDGSCSVREVQMEMYPRCVPDSAAFLGTSYVGRNDGSRLFYDSWQIHLVGVNATYSISLIQDGCVPFANAVFGDIGGEPIDAVFIHSSFENGLPDRSPFKIPGSCANQTSKPFH